MLPPFMYDMEEYMRCLDVIAETNHIEDATPEEAIVLPTAPEPEQQEE